MLQIILDTIYVEYVCAIDALIHNLVPVLGVLLYYTNTDMWC